MTTTDWQPKRGDPVRIRTTGEAATAMKITGNLVRVHYDVMVSGQSPDATTAPTVPVHRASQRPPQWFELNELEPAKP